MTIDEAVGTLSELREIVFCSKSPKRNNAIKLGIEALKYAKRSRDPSGVPSYPLLPGETEK